MSTSHLQFWPPGLSHTLALPETTICDSLDASTQRHPDKPCLIYYETPLSYAQFRAESNRLAAYLQSVCAVSPGDRVLLYMQNSPQFAMAFYAIARVGGVVVPINPMSREAELAHYIADSGAKIVIAGQEVLPHVSKFLQDDALQAGVVACYSDWIRVPTDLALPEPVSAPRVTELPAGFTSWADATSFCEPLRSVPIFIDDLCVMPYTSGTTGRPKGCMHSHRNVMFTTTAGMAWLTMQPDDVVMAALPFFHVTGMQRCLNGPILTGNTIVIMTRWDAVVAAALIERYRVTTWTGVPTMFIDLLGNPQLDHRDLSSLKRLGGGGASMPAAIAQRMNERLKIPYVEGYGLSETIAPSHINPPQRAKAQCLGIPIFNTLSHVIAPDTLQTLPQGQVGEIVINGPQVFQGYWNDSASTAAAFVEIDGQPFFRTGDLGYVDEDGYFFMVDRLKRMINASGFKVWPAEVEALLYRHPAIHEVCVIAVLDAHRGETVKALIVLKPEHIPSPTEAQLIEWARGQMSAYKVPRHVEFVSTLPKSATGKVQWRLLQEREQSFH